MQIEPYSLRGRAFAILTVTASLALSGCLGGDSDNDDAPMANPPPTPNTYSAEIQRTQFGIPHITAQDYKGLGYGLGYAFAEDNICSFAEEIVFANGESARYLPNGSVASDIFYTWYNSDAQRQKFWDAQNQQVRDAV